jgi:hypothetical protein
MKLAGLLLIVLGLSIPVSCSQYTIELAENKFSIEHSYKKLGNLVHKTQAGKSVFSVEDIDQSVYKSFLKVGLNSR